MATQLTLNIRLRDGSSLDNFYEHENREAAECLRRVIAEKSPGADSLSLFLWGEPASGKTHLLEAASRLVRARGDGALYLPLANPDVLPAALEEAERACIICLDDVQSIASHMAWESALFASYELARSTGARIIASARTPPTRLGFRMPELTSRFAGGSVYQLHVLSDDAKVAAMQLRARNRGFDLPSEVARYVLHRYPRDLVTIFALLDRIDAASLAHQRRVTIPFVRQLELPTSGS